jgi:CzcA family heavy metal efflux pump
MKWIIEPQLLSVPGVANISTYGLHPKQYHILVKPGVLRDHKITLEQVKQAARQAVVYSSPGFHDTPNQRLAVQLTTPIDVPEDLAFSVVDHRNGNPLFLHQVATVAVGCPLPIGEGVINDEPGLFVVVEKFPWGNTLEVTRLVEEKVESLKEALPAVEFTTRIFRPATFIERALGNLRFAMILGCILVAAIVIAFLFEWRTALISLTAIPLSIITALVVLDIWGIPINTMVLAGLAIAIGEVVDDAIIDVENIVRRLRQNAREGRPRSPFRVVLDASLEVRSAIVYASFIVVFVCLPIFFLEGIGGSFFRPLALAYILAIVASLAVALTVTPAMSLWLLPSAITRHEDAPLVRWLKRGYRRLLPVTLHRPRLVLGLTALLFAAAGAGAADAFHFHRVFRNQFLPDFQETDFLMHWIAKPGTGIDAMRDDIVAVSKEMRGNPKTHVKEYGSHIARAEAGEEVYGSNFAELWISLGDFKGDMTRARQAIEAVMARHPGFQFDLLTYLRERIKEVLTGTGAAIVVRIHGDDLTTLRTTAQKVRQAIDGSDGSGRPPIAGVVNLKVEAQVLVPQLEVVIDPSRAAAHGLTPGAIADALGTLINGTKVNEIHQGKMVFDLVVWSHPDVRRNLSDLRRLEIDLPSGKGTVPLEAVAQLNLVSAPNSIRHDKASRCIDVSCDVADADLEAVLGQIRQRIAPLQPEGFTFEFLGEGKARQENTRQLAVFFGLAVLGITMVFYIDFRSFRLALLLFATSLFVVIGIVAAVALTGRIFSLGSWVGGITVFGIAARNGIMMISHYRHLQLHEGMQFGRELVLRGTQERMAPILMTALSTALGLMPLAISGNQPGYEVEYPMAVVILGGLLTSTLLNLGVLPVLYEKFGNVPPPGLEEEKVVEPGAVEPGAV